MDANHLAEIQKIKDALSGIGELSVEKVLRRREIGTKFFEDIEVEMDEVVTLARRFAPLPWELFSIEIIRNIWNAVDKLDGAIKQIEGFQVTDSRYGGDTRQNATNTFKQAYEVFLMLSIQYVPFLEFADSDNDKKNKESNFLISKLNETLESFNDDAKAIEQTKVEIEKTFDLAKAVAGRSGIKEHSGIFNKAETRHLTASNWWLGASIVLIFVTTGFSWYIMNINVFEDIKDAETYKYVFFQSLFPKAFIASILYFAVIWSSRNFRSHRHLAYVNAHRHNALSTFETFVAAAKDDQTKNAVLLEATRCIFSPSITGYLGPDEEPGGGRVVEIIKTVSSSEGK